MSSRGGARERAAADKRDCRTAADEARFRARVGRAVVVPRDKPKFLAGGWYKPRENPESYDIFMGRLVSGKLLEFEMIG